MATSTLAPTKMETVANLDPTKPYHGPIKVSVLKVGRIVKYRKNGQDRQYIDLGLCDTTGVVKAICYNPESFPKFQPEKAVILKNYILREKNTLIITRMTKVLPAGRAVDRSKIPTDYYGMAQQFANPPDAEFKTAEAAKKSPFKSSVSVEGTVEEVRVHISVKGVSSDFI